jgi:hypothetical protein
MQTQTVPHPGAFRFWGRRTHSPGAAFPSFVWLYLRLCDSRYIFCKAMCSKKGHKIIDLYGYAPQVPLDIRGSNLLSGLSAPSVRPQLVGFVLNLSRWFLSTGKHETGKGGYVAGLHPPGSFRFQGYPLRGTREGHGTANRIPQRFRDGNVSNRATATSFQGVSWGWARRPPEIRTT